VSIEYFTFSIKKAYAERPTERCKKRQAHTEESVQASALLVEGSMERPKKR
jgi:hypothetical protein